MMGHQKCPLSLYFLCGGLFCLPLAAWGYGTLSTPLSGGGMTTNTVSLPTFLFLPPSSSTFSLQVNTVAAISVNLSLNNLFANILPINMPLVPL